MASVGLLVVFQAIVIDRFGASPYSVVPQLPKKGVVLPHNVTVPEDDLIAVGIVIVLTAILWAVFKYTRFGIASRANAENEKTVVLLGHAPNRLAAASWILSSVLGGLMGILVSTMNTGVDPQTIVLLVVPALAAALLGGFTSFGLPSSAAIAIRWAKVDSELESEVVVLARRRLGTSWYPAGSPSRRNSCGANRTRICDPDACDGLCVADAVLTKAEFYANDHAQDGRRRGCGIDPAPHPQRKLAYRRHDDCNRCGVRHVARRPDRFRGSDLAHADDARRSSGFALSKFTQHGALPFPLGPIAAILFATALGVVISTVAIRIRGVDLAIVTLAIAVAAEDIIFDNPVFTGKSFGSAVPPPRLGPIHLGPADPTAW